MFNYYLSILFMFIFKGLFPIPPNIIISHVLSALELNSWSTYER